MTGATHIVATAARTPVGLSAESTAAAIRARISRLREHPFMIDAAGDRLRCALDAKLDPRLKSRERMLALSQATWDEVQKKLGELGIRATGLASRLLLSLPEPRPGHGQHDARWLAQAMAAHCAGTTAEVAMELTGTGHAGVLAALQRGAELLDSGAAELCYVAGVDSYFDAETIDWLEAHKLLLRAGSRSGFPPGEGASLIVLASTSLQARLRLPCLARIVGAASAIERRTPNDDAGILGEAVTEVVRRVGAGLVEGRETIDAVYCDINGERHRVDEWGFTLLRTGALFRDGTDYVSAVSEWGDMGAASGGLSCVLAVQAFRRGYAKGTRALLWGGSWGGLRAAVLLEEGRY